MLQGGNTHVDQAKAAFGEQNIIKSQPVQIGGPFQIVVNEAVGVKLRQFVGKYIEPQLAAFHFISSVVDGVYAFHNQHFGIERIVIVEPIKLHNQFVDPVGEAHFFGLRANVRAGIARKQFGHFRI